MSDQELVPASDSETPEEAAGKAVTLSLNTVVAAINPVALATEAIKYSQFGKQAIVQAEKALFTSPESFGLGGDLMKAINSNLKALEEKRKEYTGGIDKLKEYIMALFNPGKDKLTKAKGTLQTKMDAYHRAQEIARKAEQAIAAKAAEDAALALATAQQAMGDNAGADKVMEDAAKQAARIADDTKVTGRGVYGATVSGTKRWVGSVEDFQKFVAWMIVHQPTLLQGMVEFKTAKLNDFAKTCGAITTPPLASIPGFKFEQTSKAVAR